MAKKLFKSANLAYRGAVVAAIVSAFACAASGASAETYVYKDVLRPHGAQRSQAEKQAAFKSCLDAGVRAENAPAFEACMRRQSWALAYIRPDASDRPGATYDDMWQKPDGEKRSDEALNADAQACNPSGTKSAASADIKRCMLGRGWRFAFVVPEPGAAAPARAASAHGDTNVWIDVSGHGRSDAQTMADANACEYEVGADPIGLPTSAPMKRCMLARGWRFDHTYQSNDAAARQWFDPDKGLVCHSIGFADVCTAPEGHVDYFDPKHGMNCHRDGGLKVCANF